MFCLFLGGQGISFLFCFVFWFSLASSFVWFDIRLLVFWHSSFGVSTVFGKALFSSTFILSLFLEYLGIIVLCMPRLRLRLRYDMIYIMTKIWIPFGISFFPVCFWASNRKIFEGSVLGSAQIVVSWKRSAQGTISFRSFRCDPNIDVEFCFFSFPNGWDIM